MNLYAALSYERNTCYLHFSEQENKLFLSVFSNILVASMAFNIHISHFMLLSADNK